MPKEVFGKITYDTIFKIAILRRRVRWSWMIRKFLTITIFLWFIH